MTFEHVSSRARAPSRPRPSVPFAALVAAMAAGLIASAGAAAQPAPSPAVTPSAAPAGPPAKPPRAAGSDAAKPAPDRSPRTRAATATPEAVSAARAVSAYRARFGLRAVTVDPVLTRLAREQADAMARADTLSHAVAGGFESRIAAAGLRRTPAAENLGAGYASLEAAMAGWIASPGHERNLRMAEATRIGIARARAAGGAYGTYWALVLAGEPEAPLSAGPLVARPRSPAPAPPASSGGFVLPFGLRIGP